ncbi:hypothetical protein CVT24_011651 [Panaeolus cyanescens]|uniref:Protein PBN1 n=1 Tax=Panaeolus cyanescens TaxID=181874 RepID=A0A409YH15_9AGAR|nr:hypothetical protein CVT24_011651 [Panaeolus cyanescens]
MAHFNTQLNPNKGFHPSSVTTINIPEKHHQQCSLHLYFNLPALVFADTNELSQRSNDYTYEYWGNIDLEKPVHALPDSRTELLLTLPFTPYTSSTTKEPRVIEVSVPLHLRYGSPRKQISSENSQAYERINIDWPTPFFRCPDSTTPSETGTLTLPKHILEVLDNSTTNGHVLIPIPPHPEAGPAQNSISLPLGSKNDLAFVEPITAVTILLCAFWILRVALKTSSRLASRNTKATNQPEKIE